MNFIPQSNHFEEKKHQIGNEIENDPQLLSVQQELEQIRKEKEHVLFHLQKESTHPPEIRNILKKIMNVASKDEFQSIIEYYHENIITRIDDCFSESLGNSMNPHDDPDNWKWCRKFVNDWMNSSI